MNLEYGVPSHIFKFGTVRYRFRYSTGMRSGFGTNCSSLLEMVVKVAREMVEAEKIGVEIVENVVIERH